MHRADWFTCSAMELKDRAKSPSSSLLLANAAALIFPLLPAVAKCLLRAVMRVTITRSRNAHRTTSAASPAPIIMIMAECIADAPALLTSRGEFTLRYASGRAITLRRTDVVWMRSSSVLSSTFSGRAPKSTGWGKSSRVKSTPVSCFGRLDVKHFCRDDFAHWVAGSIALQGRRDCHEE